MVAGEKLVANDGYEVMLFPLEYMNISQDEGGSYSHANTYSIDFLGWGSSGRVWNCPYYAPCSCKCVNTSFGTGSNSRVFQSLDKVHWPDGTFDYITFNTMHDDYPIASLNQVFEQGDLIGHTGTTGQGVTGDHLHFNIAQGIYRGFYNVGTGHYQLVGTRHIYDGCYVNDTTIINGGAHTWKKYTGEVFPDYRKYKFKWVLYANKLRNKNV